MSRLGLSLAKDLDELLTLIKQREMHLIKLLNLLLRLQDKETTYDSIENKIDYDIIKLEGSRIQQEDNLATKYTKYNAHKPEEQR